MYDIVFKKLTVLLPLNTKGTCIMVMTSASSHLFTAFSITVIHWMQTATLQKSLYKTGKMASVKTALRRQGKKYLDVKMCHTTCNAPLSNIL